MTKRIIAVFVVLMMFTLIVGCSQSGTTNSAAGTDATSSSVTVSEPVKEQPVSEPESVGASESQLSEPAKEDDEIQLRIVRATGEWDYYNERDTVPVRDGDLLTSSLAGFYSLRFEINGQKITKDDHPIDFMTDGENVLVMFIKEGEFLDEYSQTYKAVLES